MSKPCDEDTHRWNPIKRGEVVPIGKPCLCGKRRWGQAR